MVFMVVSVPEFIGVSLQADCLKQANIQAVFKREGKSFPRGVHYKPLTTDKHLFTMVVEKQDQETWNN